MPPIEPLPHRIAQRFAGSEGISTRRGGFHDPHRQRGQGVDAGHGDGAGLEAGDLPARVLQRGPQLGLDGDLYRYLTERIGSLDGVRESETAPILRTLKRVAMSEDEASS
ncbi:hypothetical protein GCM10022267_68910 [Lentzea roselyniae]|uniref:Uncharacterized protein n=1 Tax=Lentzea roselyniae TaxID=531940 RepID=A0ABP7C0B7_9PSEU